MRRIIINADDFGLTPGITDGILEAHHEGILTSTTLLVGAPDAARAARLAASCPRLGVGLHLALTAVKPILPPGSIKTLVTPDGNFPYNFLPVAIRLSLGRIDLREVKRELEAQILAARDLGVDITHVDGHNHLHAHPRVLPVVLDLMQRHGIPAIRCPQVSPLLRVTPRARLKQALRGVLLAGSTLGARSRISRQGAITTDHFVGFEQSGHMTSARLTALLEGALDGSTEIMMHPGRKDDLLERQHDWGYLWEHELSALKNHSIRTCLSASEIELIHFGTLTRIS